MKIKKNRQLTIGLPVRNEEKNLANFLVSLKSAIKLLDKNIKVEIISCLNGTTDNSEKIIDNFKIDKIYSREGKINAEKAIIKNRLLSGPICFIDTDILLHKKCLVNLWKEMNIDSSLQVVYAKVFPIIFNKRTLIEKIQYIHYKHPEALTPRRYIHGRCFMLRSTTAFNYSVFRNIPLVDDIYLSRIIAHQHGLDSIKEIKNAIIYFVPPRSIRDFYYGQKRLISEINKLDKSFPEHVYLQKKFFKRKINYKMLSLENQFKYFIYHLFELLIRMIVRLKLLLSLIRIFKIRNFWVPLTSTKKYEKT